MVVKDVFGKIVNIDIPADVFPTKEEIEAVEAVLPNCQHGWYKSVTDDVDLHYRYWKPTSGTTNDKPKGIVIYTHGVNSHSGHAARPGGRPIDVVRFFVLFHRSMLISLDEFLQKRVLRPLHFWGLVMR